MVIYVFKLKMPENSISNTSLEHSTWNNPRPLLLSLNKKLLEDYFIEMGNLLKMM